MKIFYLLTVFLILTSCMNNEEILFKIKPPTKNTNDFLYMAESSNVAYIPREHILKYLTIQEIGAAELFHYKEFETIYENDTFKILILLKEGSDSGRDYTFILRTINLEHKIIDSYDFATWIDSDHMYCFGSINTDLNIKRTCDGGESYEMLQILENGQIVEMNYE